MARPTKSQSLYIQMVGRGLRKDKNPETTKENCLVLDFTDKHNNLKLNSPRRVSVPEDRM